MHRTTIALALALASNVAIASNAWQECRDNVESYMWAQGWCGASNCYSADGKSLGVYTTEQCGYPEHTKAERKALIEEAAKNCTLSGGKLDCDSMPVFRALDYYAPSDPIHSQISDAIWAK